MSTLTADQFLERVLGDEGWQAPLDGASIEAAIGRLEALLPAEATVGEARGEAIRASLRELAAIVAALKQGELDEPMLVAAWLRRLEV